MGAEHQAIRQIPVGAEPSVQQPRGLGPVHRSERGFVELDVRALQRDAAPGDEMDASACGRADSTLPVIVICVKS